MSIQYDFKKDKELFLKVMKYFANDESMTPYMKDEKIKKRFIDEAEKSFGTANVNEVFYDPKTDSYLINPNCIPPNTSPTTRL